MRRTPLMTMTSSIVYKEVHDLEEIKAIVAFQALIWSNDVVTPLPQLVAAHHHGGVIIAAFHEEQVVGFAYGFPGFKKGHAYLISHMTAVHPSYQNAGVGLALKLKQREWAMKDGGYQKMVWTYDPLEARNAYFNLMKLGGYTSKYIHAYYGEMDDKLNKGLPSDRFLVEWDLFSKRVERALTNTLSLQTSVYDYTEPLNKEDIKDDAGYLVPVPTNIQEIKLNDLNEAMEWRYHLRELFTLALDKGYVVTGLLKGQHPEVHYYVLQKDQVSIR